MSIKKGFSLSEVLVTLGVLGVVAGMTIPTLAYNYRAKVLETQFRSTYSEVMNIGAMLAKDNGDIGNFSRNTNYANAANGGAINNNNGSTEGTIRWAKEFGSYIPGFVNVWNTPNPQNIGAQQKNALTLIYANAGHPGPYRFRTSIAGTVGVSCNNGGIWSDLKGRIWTFNSENQMVCVDVNGTAPPNRMNIDIFAFIPMSASQVSMWVYGEDTDSRASRSNYSSQFVLCDLDKIIEKRVSDNVPGEYDHWIPSIFYEWKRYPKDNPKTALDLCPFNAPVENVAGGTVSSRGRSVNPVVDDYWKKYIDYR